MRKEDFRLPKWISCQIIARPCCIGYEGKCEIVSQDYCKAVRGIFHKEAALCAQVNLFGVWLIN